MDVILAKEIIYMLKNEGYHPGDRLPSERFLAEHFHVQRPTIRNALAQLVREHYLFSQERLGYFVAPDRIKISTHTCTDNFDPGERCPNIRWQPYSFEEILVDKRLSGKHQFIKSFSFIMKTTPRCAWIILILQSISILV